MAVSLFFTPVTSPNTIAEIRLDATTEERHSRSASVTDNPVEGGSSIQDHIVNGPRMLDMSGIVTDTPILRDDRFIDDVRDNLPGFVLEQLGNVNEGRVQAAFDALEELYDRRQTFTVISGFRVYENMALVSLDIPKTRESAVRFSATMKQLTITNSQQVDIPAETVADDENDTRDLAESEADGGRRDTQAASPEQTTQGGSVLSRGVDFIGGVF